MSGGRRLVAGEGRDVVGGEVMSRGKGSVGWWRGEGAVRCGGAEGSLVFPLCPKATVEMGP